MKTREKIIGVLKKYKVECTSTEIINDLVVIAGVPQPESQVNETKAIQKNDDSYHLSCQNCGTTSKPLQMIPFRNDDNVVGLLMACDDCKDILYGERFDRESKFSHPAPKQSEKECGDMKKCMYCEKEVEYSSGIFTCEECSGKQSEHGISENDKLIGYVDYIYELIKYINVLNDELDEVVVQAHIHGWRSRRVEDGKRARKKLDELSKALLLPSFKAALSELSAANKD